MSRTARFIRQIHFPTVAAGAVGYVLFFVLLPSLHPDAALRGKIDADAIRAEANEWAQALGVNPDEYYVDYATLRDGDLLSYLQQDRSLRQVTAQVRSGEVYPMPVYYQRVRYYRQVDDEDLRERVMELRFLPSGGLVHLDVREGARISGNPAALALAPHDTVTATSIDPAAVATRHLATTAWRALDFQVDSVATGPGSESYEIFLTTDTTLAGTNPRLQVVVREDGALQRIAMQRYDTEEEPQERSATVGIQFGMSGDGGVVKAITHAVLFILLLVLFFRRLDARLVDTRGALRDGLWAALWGVISGTMVMTKAMFGADMGSGVGVIIVIFGSLFFSALTLLLVFVASSVGDSYAREAWPDRLRALDFIRRLTILNPYVGSALWHGVAVAGVLLALGALALGVPGSTLSLGDDFLSGVSYRPVVSSMADAIWFSAYITFGVVAAIGGLLRLKRPRFAMVVPIVVLVLLSITPFSISTTWISVLYNLLVGVVIVWAFNRMGAVTTVVGIGTALLVGVIMPGWMAMPAATAIDFIATVGIVAALLVVGYIGASSVMRAEEREPYIPAYIIEHSEQQRLEREIEIARHVQMSFLPRAMPQVAGMDADAMCLPAYEVGGDYYDLIVLDEDRVAVVIGDVSGKGIQAAFYMTLVKGIIQTLAGSETSPRSVLSRLNKVFFDVVPRGTFITLIYGVMDFRTGRFRYARAGHHPLLVLRGDETEFIRPNGMAIGFLGDDRFEDSLEEHELKLDIGDFLVLYTDGITEAVNIDREQFGEEGLVEALKGANDTTASDMMMRLREALDRFAAPEGRMDDMTMIVLRRVPDVVGPNAKKQTAIEEAAEPVAV